MYPHERSLVKKLADKPFALIGVNSDDNLDEIREIVKEKNITWRSFWNGEDGTSGPISTAWNVSGWPTIYILDAEGVIRFKNERGEDLDAALTELLAEMGHEVDLSNHDEEPEDSEDGDDEDEDGDDDNDDGDDEDGDDDDDDGDDDDGDDDDGDDDDGDDDDGDDDDGDDGDDDDGDDDGDDDDGDDDDEDDDEKKDGNH